MSIKDNPNSAFLKMNMKIILTGSLGHIGKPLAEILAKQGHDVTVISSKEEKRKDIEALGAAAAIGSVEDASFLSKTFTGADAVFCMVPPNFAAPDQVAYYSRIGTGYAQAIQQSGVKRVVDLSSYGAHLEKGTGFITGSHRNEQMFAGLPNVSVTHIRPGYFYYNLLGMVGTIKATGQMMANYGEGDKLLMVSPVDIAAAVAEELTRTSTGRDVRYVASDDRTCNEVATVLGNAIGKPDLKWSIISSEQMLSGLERAGVPKNAAENLVELGEATHSGILREDYETQKTEMGKVKLEDFAQEFAAVYNNEKK